MDSRRAVCWARNPDIAFAYLKATNSGRVPEEVVRALADGMAQCKAYVRYLAIADAEFSVREGDGVVMSDIDAHRQSFLCEKSCDHAPLCADAGRGGIGLGLL